MYDVTDAAFRAIIAKYGKPDVMFTEFVSAEGLNNIQGRARLAHHLKFSDAERPIVAQIFGSHPEQFAPAAEFIAGLGFDGIDINMGCPDKNIIKQGSCAALFGTPHLAQEIIRETRRGASGLPISVKIRIGDTKIDWQNWIAALLAEEPAAISIHLRTRKEMSKVPAHWEVMPEIVSFIRNRAGNSAPLILGNGDVLSIEGAERKILESGCDGVMIGKGVFGNPWLFARRKKEPAAAERIAVLLEHTKLFQELLATEKNFEIMKKHYKAYVSGFGGAAALRAELMQAKNSAQVETILGNNGLTVPLPAAIV